MAAGAQEATPGLGSDDEDGDSALEVGNDSETESICSSVYAYPVENGRTYHAYHDGAYPFPNDQMEQGRLDLQHSIFLCLLEGRFYLSPVETPSNVLDLGTGTGVWAQAVADSQPESVVVGVDLSPIQSEWVSPNCCFEVVDFEDPWTFQRKFDFICGRMLIGSISSPLKLFREVFEGLMPGGWVEIQDVCPPTSMPQNSSFRLWRNAWCSALQRGDRDPYLVRHRRELQQVNEAA